MSEQNEQQAETAEQKSERTAPSAPAAEVEYVVQIADESGYWRDISKLRAPLRTRRRTLIGRALEQAGVKPEVGMADPRLRILDADSAQVHVVPVVVAEPRFDI